MCDDYSKVLSKSKYRAKQGTGLKILTLKQMLQRLSIALSQVKVGNNSESLFNRPNCLFFVSIKRNY